MRTAPISCSQTVSPTAYVAGWLKLKSPFTAPSGNIYELDLYQMIRLLIMIDKEDAKEVAKVYDLYPYYQAIVNEPEIKEVA